MQLLKVQFLSETGFQSAQLHNPLGYTSQRGNTPFNANLEQQSILAAGQLCSSFMES